MGENPFHEDLDDTFRGVRVRVQTDEYSMRDGRAVVLKVYC
jgi:hypothetical protein